jgi:nucleoside-diphosphate-sugar epimerase
LSLPDAMTVFVAGGSGAIGVPLVRALVSAGYRVVAATRSPKKEPMLQDLGATVVVVDALDAGALDRAVRSVSPTDVIHELTALPKAGARRARDMEPTNRLREEGTRNLLAAAIAAGAKRFIGGSFALIGAYPQDSGVVTAIRSMESQILDTSRNGAIEGIVLRYGLFYGAGNAATEEMLRLVRRRQLPVIRGDRGQLSYIHVLDAAAATVAALDHGVTGQVYDIVDDHPASFSEVVREMASLARAPHPFAIPSWLLRLFMPFMAELLTFSRPLSNAKARADLGWQPKFPSYREGCRQVVYR